MKYLFAYGYSRGTTAYYYEHALRKKGIVTTCGPSSDVTKQQDIPCNYNADILPIIKKTRPDYLLLFPEGNFYLPRDINHVTIPKILFITDLYINYSWLQFYTGFFDIIFSASDKYKIYLNNKGRNTFYLPVACDPNIQRDYNITRTYDIGFVGNLNDLYLPKRSLYLNTFEKYFNLKLASNVYYKDLAKIYSQSKIVLNISSSKELNMRFFEAMSCGSMLLTDALPNRLQQSFPENTFISYHSLKEAVKLAEYYLKHSEERKKIADMGQEMVRKYHTYEKRVELMLEKIASFNFYDSQRAKSGSILKTHFFLNCPDFDTRKLNEKKAGILINIIGQVPWTWRKYLVIILKRLNVQEMKKIISWIYYLSYYKFFLVVERFRSKSRDNINKFV